MSEQSEPTTDAQSTNTTQRGETYRKNGIKFEVCRTCPHSDCTWTLDRPVTACTDSVFLDRKAEEHWEREHAGEIQLTAVFKKTVTCTNHNDAQRLSDNLFDELVGELPAGLELMITYGEVIDEADVLAEEDVRGESP